MRGADRPGDILRFTNVGIVIVAMAITSVLTELSPALFALGDRSVRERRTGALYALGVSGLYVRTESFERRESWERVHAVRSAGMHLGRCFWVSRGHVAAAWRSRPMPWTRASASRARRDEARLLRRDSP